MDRFRKRQCDNVDKGITIGDKEADERKKAASKIRAADEAFERRSKRIQASIREDMAESYRVREAQKRRSERLQEHIRKVNWARHNQRLAKVREMERDKEREEKLARVRESIACAWNEEHEHFAGPVRCSYIETLHKKFTKK